MDFVRRIGIMECNRILAVAALTVISLFYPHHLTPDTMYTITAPQTKPASQISLLSSMIPWGTG